VEKFLQRRKSQHQEASFMTFALEYANMESLLHIKLKNLAALPSLSVQTIQLKAKRKKNKTSYEMLASNL